MCILNKNKDHFVYSFSDISDDLLLKNHLLTERLTHCKVLK